MSRASAARVSFESIQLKPNPAMLLLLRVGGRGDFLIPLLDFIRLVVHGPPLHLTSSSYDPLFLFCLLVFLNWIHYLPPPPTCWTLLMFIPSSLFPFRLIQFKKSKAKKKLSRFLSLSFVCTFIPVSRKHDKTRFKWPFFLHASIHPSIKK